MIGFIELRLEKNGKALFPSIQVTESTLTHNVHFSEPFVATLGLATTFTILRPL